MKVLLSSIEDQTSESVAVVSEINYDREKGHFWMRCVMGDDWFQRVTSPPEHKPRIVRAADNLMFVVFDLQSESERFSIWLAEAQAAVEYGYRTMRG